MPAGPAVVGGGVNECSFAWQQFTIFPAGLEARLNVSQGWLTLRSQATAPCVIPSSCDAVAGPPKAARGRARLDKTAISSHPRVHGI